MEVIKWLDSHNGLVTAAATIVLTIITGFYVYLTRHLLKATTTPKIAIYLRTEETHSAKLYVENIGTGIAENIRFEGIDPRFDLSPDFSLKEVGFIKNAIKYLAPGHRHECYMIRGGSMQCYIETQEPFKITVTYKNPWKLLCRKENFDIYFQDPDDLYDASASLLDIASDITQTLKDIKETLRSVRIS